MHKNQKFLLHSIWKKISLELHQAVLKGLITKQLLHQQGKMTKCIQLKYASSTLLVTFPPPLFPFSPPPPMHGKTIYLVHILPRRVCRVKINGHMIECYTQFSFLLIARVRNCKATGIVSFKTNFVWHSSVFKGPIGHWPDTCFASPTESIFILDRKISMELGELPITADFGGVSDLV